MLHLRIREAREAAGLSQRALAAALDDLRAAMGRLDTAFSVTPGRASDPVGATRYEPPDTLDAATFRRIAALDAAVDRGEFLTEDDSYGPRCSLMHKVDRMITRREMPCVLVFAFLFVSGTVRAATFQPVNPTDQDQIRADFYIRGGCTTNISTVVAGTNVRVTVTNTHCLPVPGFVVPVQVVFGPLPANTYSFEIYESLEDDPPALQSQQTLIVAATAPPVPALDVPALIAAIVALGLAALFVLGRPPGPN